MNSVLSSEKLKLLSAYDNEKSSKWGNWINGTTNNWSLEILVLQVAL